ncbi:MAG TPA: cysteine desulfurase family protein, partial [Bryobacteraceae bacterium]|nr:cysteine desulfurase family protein [Bryobacteraceae bacterium]
NATTPLAPEVLDVHVKALREVYGNASSIHQPGQAAKEALENGRRSVASLIHANPREVVFLSGGTEANNLAIFGSVRASGEAEPHVITTAIEHPAVLNPCAQLERNGIAVTYVRVGSSGVVEPDDIRRALRPETVLISVMHVNNELGTIQPVAEIAYIAREAGAAMHSDGVQAAGRVPVDMAELGVDLYSISGHKMYAPKGIGALYVRKGSRLTPMILGGRHEHQRRAGTENVPAVAAFGAAAAGMQSRRAEETARLAELRDRLESGVRAQVEDVRVNGSLQQRSPNATNLCFDGIEGESLVISLDLKGFAVSTGSACSSGAVEPSHVLTAIGLSKEEARSSVRFSLGLSNTADQVDRLIEAIAASAAHLRNLSPTYKLHA